MDTNPLTISLHDETPGYEINPERVPLATLASFASDVRDFLRGSSKDGDVDKTEVAVISGSLAVAVQDYTSPSLVHDLGMLSVCEDLDQIDSKRRAVVLRWQALARNKNKTDIRILTPQGGVIAITNETNFRAGNNQRLVNVERYIHGEVVDLGGATQPNAHIKLSNGETLVVSTDKELIRKQTDNHLYKQVHVRIRAKLNLETGKLSDANLIEFINYSPRFDQEAFDKLTAIGDKAWKDVGDPAEWVRKIRGALD